MIDGPVLQEENKVSKRENDNRLRGGFERERDETTMYVLRMRNFESRLW